MGEAINETRSENEPLRTGERLARFLAHAGVASRRHADQLISAGRVRVNGEVITELGTRIDPLHDQVSVDGKTVQASSEKVYLLLHKPAGYVSTAHDPQGRPTVLDLLPEEIRSRRVYPVGRLDIDTSGLLLLTNDGDFALRLTHPRYIQEKHYEALVQGHPTEDTLEHLHKGVIFTEDGGQHHKSAPARVRLLGRAGANSWLALTIHEGRKRQIRRMLEAVGHRVLQLRRIGVGDLKLNNVPIGRWRYLSEDEVARLQST